MTHSPASVREAKGFIARNGKQVGNRKPKPTEVLRERVEADIDRFLAPYYEALRADRAVVVGTGPRARVETVPDIPTRMKAADAVLDRVYGKPVQATEISGPDGGPVGHQLEVPSDEARTLEVAAILSQVGAVDSVPQAAIDESDG